MKLNAIPYKWLVAVAFVSAFFMDLMDSTIVNVALPKLALDLNASGTALEWIITGYLLSLAIWIPVSGWLGDRFGTKKTFLFALMVFVIGSALCSLAPNVGMLLFFRVLQGVGGGMMTPVGIAMLFRAFPPNERAEASSILAIPAAVAPAIGPVIGGWLTDYVGWRWIFLVNVPIGLAAFIYGWKFLKEYKGAHPGKFDAAGFFLSAAGTVSILYGLSSVPTHGIRSLTVIISILVGIILIAILIWTEAMTKSPILHFSLFKERLFRATNTVMFFAFSLWFGFLFVLPLFLQQLRGLSAFESGLTTAPQAVGWIAMSFVAGKIYGRLGPRRMIFFGLIGTTAMTLIFVFINTDINLWLVRVILFFRGLSMAFAIIPIQAATFTNISAEETGRASSLFNTNRQLAASFGVALAGSVLFEILNQSSATSFQLSAYHLAFAATVILGLVAIFFTLIIKDRDAATSFRLKH